MMELDLEIIAAMTRRANHRLFSATLELDEPQCAETQRKIDRALEELGRLAAKIPHEQRTEDVEPGPTSRDSGTEHTWGEQARDSASAEGQQADGARGVALRFGPGGVSRKQIHTLSELEFIAKAENLVQVEPLGVGKTGLASSLLLKALENG
jgi:hypothetical protein